MVRARTWNRASISPLAQPASLNQAIRLLEQRGAIGGNSEATTVEKN